MDKPMIDKLAILWTSGDKETAMKMILMYVLKTEGWQVLNI